MNNHTPGPDQPTSQPEQPGSQIRRRRFDRKPLQVPRPDLPEPAYQPPPALPGDAGMATPRFFPVPRPDLPEPAARFQAPAPKELPEPQVKPPAPAPVAIEPKPEQAPARRFSRAGRTPLRKTSERTSEMPPLAPAAEAPVAPVSPPAAPAPRRSREPREAREPRARAGRRESEAVTVSSPAVQPPPARAIPGHPADAMERLRPSSLDEVVGQSQAIRSLISKLASPYPRHVILYGPPGVGKASVARLALEKVKSFSYTAFARESPFVEVDAATLGQEPVAMFIPLRRRPVAKGKEKEGTLELGAVGRAHGGILFVNEISDLAPAQLTNLLRIMDSHKISIDPAWLEQAGAKLTPEERHQVQDGIPTSFVLVASTSHDPDHLTAALRTRCGEVFFKPLFPLEIARIVAGGAQKLGVTVDDQAAAFIGRYTNVGRRAVELLLDAVGLATLQQTGKTVHLGIDELREMAAVDRLAPTLLQSEPGKAVVGRVVALDAGRYSGFPAEIEAALLPAAVKGEGQVRCAPQFQTVVEEAVENADAVIRTLAGVDLNDYDIYVRIQTQGKGNLSGLDLPVVIALLSVLKKQPLPGDVAITGRINLQGEVLPVENSLERVIGAQAAGYDKVILPLQSRSEISAQVEDVQLIPATTVLEAFEALTGQKGAPAGERQPDQKTRRHRGGRGRGRTRTR